MKNQNTKKNTMISFLKKIQNKLTGLLFALVMSALMSTSYAIEQITYFHNDALGSPVAATDESGNLKWREEYLPYGERLLKQDNSANDTWFTGKQEDKATGLSYFGARWYDPVLGRFTGIDPVGFQEDNIHSFNRYAYANNNPYKFVDPDGRVAETALDVISLGLSIATFKSDPSFINGLGVAYDGLATAVPFLPAGFGIVKSAGKKINKVDLKETGSYTNTHASGKTYSGKGTRTRSQQSGRRQARQNNDPHVATDFTPAKNTRDAFKQESKRIDSNGGVKSSSNYNKAESPGRKYRQQDRK